VISIRIENKLLQLLSDTRSKIRSLLLFGNPTRVKFGKGVRITGRVSIGENVSIRDFTNIRGKDIFIENNVFIHENVLIRSNAKIVIGEGTTINRNCCILAKVMIGKDCSIAPNVVIAGSNHKFNEIEVSVKKQGVIMNGIIIEDDVWISANATILDGVTIGKGSVIAAGAVVNKDVPPLTVVGGVPARILKARG